LAAPPIDPQPQIDVFSAAPQPVFAGQALKLSVTRVHDPDQRIHSVTFYRDNGNGVLEPLEDVLVGADANSSGGWTTSAETAGLPAGTYTYFAQALDSSGQVLAEASLLSDVVVVEVVEYASADVPKPIPDRSTITSTITVPDSITVLDLDVTLDITHTGDTDLDVFLIAPNGMRLALFQDVGSLGDNFSGTILDDEASTGIAAGSAPFTGRFQPQSALSALDGIDAAGIWTLEITDDERKDTGTLNAWSLNVTHALDAAANNFREAAAVLGRSLPAVDSLAETLDAFGQFAATGAEGDTNADGVVDIDDLNAVRNNFGAGASSLRASAVESTETAIDRQSGGRSESFAKTRAFARLPRRFSDIGHPMVFDLEVDVLSDLAMKKNSLPARR
jgi:subtilisin-like proprotein convertase family protein